eukprot:365942-Chlamydomonas_euryale.AAC.5
MRRPQRLGHWLQIQTPALMTPPQTQAQRTSAEGAQGANGRLAGHWRASQKAKRRLQQHHSARSGSVCRRRRRPDTRKHTADANPTRPLSQAAVLPPSPRPSTPRRANYSHLAERGHAAECRRLQRTSQTTQSRQPVKGRVELAARESAQAAPRWDERCG